MTNTSPENQSFGSFIVVDVLDATIIKTPIFLKTGTYAHSQPKTRGSLIPDNIKLSEVILLFRDSMEVLLLGMFKKLTLGDKDNFMCIKAEKEFSNKYIYLSQINHQSY